MRLRLVAPAKVNLVLEVVGRRADGFHDLVSVVHCVSLSDVLDVRTDSELNLETDGDVGPIEENLAYRAARDLRESAGVGDGAALRLRKRIPVGAGLGGGSSDGAATLRLLDRLWGVRAGQDDLLRLAGRLGSDVPLFLGGAAALIEGRGERVRPLPPLGHGELVLAVPRWRVELKTARVFGALRPDELTTGERARTMARAMNEGTDVEQAMFWNGLEPAAERVFPRLGDLKRELERATGVRFALSGAGPTLFHLTADRPRAAECAARARQLPVRLYRARPLRRRPSVRVVTA